MNTLRKVLGGSTLSAILALAGSVISPPAQAVIGTLDRVPAATLLLPYFEDDLTDPNGTQTRFTLVNASDSQQLAHVTLWTDMGVPTLDFDLYLGGFDSVEVDLRLLFTKGILPQTTPGFPHGPDSHSHTAVSSCSATATYAGFPAPDTLTPLQIAHLNVVHRGAHTAVFGNMCAAANHGDLVARGYITIDAVNTCSSKFPTDSGYFGGAGTGVASDKNTLFGTYTIIDRGSNVSTASPLVSIEASSTDPLTTTAGNYTFYASMVNASAIDNREPLGTVWQARYLDGGIFDGSELVVWRDPAFIHAPFTCGTTPADFPRMQTEITSFDEQEHYFILNSIDYYPNPQPPPIVPFALLAQRTPVAVMSPFNFGFIHLNLNTPVPGEVVSPLGLVQSYVAVRQQASGKFGAALPATYLWGPQYQVAGAGQTPTTGGPFACPTPGTVYPACYDRPTYINQ